MTVILRAVGLRLGVAAVVARAHMIVGVPAAATSCHDNIIRFVAACARAGCRGDRGGGERLNQTAKDADYHRDEL